MPQKSYYGMTQCLLDSKKYLPFRDDKCGTKAHLRINKIPCQIFLKSRQLSDLLVPLPRMYIVSISVQRRRDQGLIS